MLSQFSFTHVLTPTYLQAPRPAFPSSLSSTTCVQCSGQGQPVSDIELRPWGPSGLNTTQQVWDRSFITFRRLHLLLKCPVHQDFASCGFINLKQGCCLSVSASVFGMFVCFCGRVLEGNSSIIGLMAQAILLCPVAIFLMWGWRSLVLWLRQGATFWAWQKQCFPYFCFWNSYPFLPIQGLLLFIPVHPNTHSYILMSFISTLMPLLHIQIHSVQLDIPQLCQYTNYCTVSQTFLNQSIKQVVPSLSLTSIPGKGIILFQEDLCRMW